MTTANYHTHSPIAPIERAVQDRAKTVSLDLTALLDDREARGKGSVAAVEIVALESRKR